MILQLEALHAADAGIRNQCLPHLCDAPEILLQSL